MAKRYCINPEGSNERFYGNSFQEIAKENGLVKIGKYYHFQSGRKAEKKVEEKKEEVKKEGFFDKK